MSKLSKLVGKSSLVTIGDIQLEIKPLSVSSFDLISGLASENKEEQMECMKKLINQTLKDAVPDATDEEIENISLEHTLVLMEKIMEVNKLEPNVDKEFIEKLKKKDR